MTPQLWVTLICAVLGSGGVTAIITYILTERKERKVVSSAHIARQKAIGEAVMLLVLSELQARCMRIINAGKRTAIESKQLIKFREAYKANGGDGWADDLYEAAMEQPIVENDNAINFGGAK